MMIGVRNISVDIEATTALDSGTEARSE